MASLSQASNLPSDAMLANIEVEQGFFKPESWLSRDF
jgi:hypothetical protein